VSSIIERSARTILLATDFSETSQEAARVALAYARALGASLHILHVAEPGARAATALLMAEAERCVPGTQVTTAVRFGDPAPAIVEYAHSQGIDLIVVGTHGRTGVSRALLGSVAERVVRSSSRPVLTVPGRGLRPITAAARELATALPLRRCLVCGASSDDLICEPCRARIRGEALDRKQREERAGRMDR
jgi:nucleotide-binding universal stress UspA family protein